jgi:hypothetical protein
MLPTTNNCEGSIPLIFREDRQVFEGYKGNKGTFVLKDIFFTIFLKCVEQRDLITLGALSCLNKYHYTMITEFAANQKIPLTEFFAWLHGRCDKIKIWDPEAFQYTSALPILRCNFDYLKAVEGDAGGVAFYYKERSIRELVAWGKELGVTVEVWDDLLAEDDKLLPEEAQICFVTNGIFQESRNKKPQALQDLVKNERRCQMFTARKAIYFALLTLKMSNGATVVFGQHPWTYTYTFTPYETRGVFLAVGGCAPARLNVDYSRLVLESYGAGGLRKFSAIGY